eukprot:CAMPEP_0185796122 /NCGR_PEP_ID=MMETSP1174-20130828/160909_1 /TAXON_ID=35687 /ORGANISM="Dictyocha speculum, Strain CCMP1381" /LENGTH=86 /DNA_ID=CAMNT_0028491461 /DNA_START=431 /DNA_END=691 /DNA_ORIENTATION=-
MAANRVDDPDQPVLVHGTVALCGSNIKVSKSLTSDCVQHYQVDTGNCFTFAVEGSHHENLPRTPEATRKRHPAEGHEPVAGTYVHA